MNSQTGLADATLFLSGILFTTSASIKTVPHLQQVIQADATYMQFGKYTLFSAYGSTADGSMFPVAFAIMFRNESKESWGHFWRFAAKHHLSLNCQIIMLFVDQDKGLIHAIKQYVPIGHHFHCSWHRKGNIMKSCGGGIKVNSGWWYFNQLFIVTLWKKLKFNGINTWPRLLPRRFAKSIMYIIQRNIRQQGVV